MSGIWLSSLSHEKETNPFIQVNNLHLDGGACMRFSFLSIFPQ